MRFSYAADATSEGGAWFYARDHTTIGALLDVELRSVLEREVGKVDAATWEGVGVQ